jgi:superfamily II DNA or RNA helicase
MNLRPYQDLAINTLARKLVKTPKMVFQLATGGGKTVTFAGITKRFLEKQTSSVLIIVHRKELLDQARRTFWEFAGINAQIIVAGMRYVPPAKAYIAMVESLKNRIPDNIGLVIIDEAHMGNFKKVHDWFPDKYIIGFTATPLSSDKKHPLKKDYQDIVCAIDTPELIKQGYLCQNITFAPRDAVDRKNLTIKGKDYDEGLMGAEFSQPKYVRNTRLAYERHSKGDKTIIFNVTIDHSLKVAQEFAEHGYSVRHLDGMMNKTERNKIIEWFKSTPSAILCNVGIATTGFDVPEIETVIVNRATISLVLWLQMCGRGSRALDWKKIFKIIDLGGNTVTHGDWSSPRDWENIFWNPPKPSDGNGVAPIKSCPQCEALIPAQCRTCPHCGFEIPKSEQEEEEEQLIGELVTMANGLDVKELIEQQKHRKKYRLFFLIGEILADEAKRIVPQMTPEIFEHILNQYYEKGEQWCEANGMKWNQWHKDRALEKLVEEIEKRFKKYKHHAEHSV